MSGKIRRFTADSVGMAEFVEMMRQVLNLTDEDEFEALRNVNHITIVKTGRLCFMCGGDKNIETVGSNKFLCTKCIAAVNKVLNK